MAEVDGYIYDALHPAPPSPSETISKYFDRSMHLYLEGFSLLVVSDESLEDVGDQVNRWASADVNGESIRNIDGRWEARRVPIERFVRLVPWREYEEISPTSLNVYV